MPDIEDDEINVTVAFSHKIQLIRFLGDTMQPARLKLYAEVFVSDEADVRDIDFDVTFAKIKFWFETVIARCIVFSRTNTNAMDILVNDQGKPKVVNHMMITPCEPTDEHLAVLFQSKMAAMSNGTFEFGPVRVSSDQGLIFTYVGDWRNDLPAMDQWFTGKPYYFEKPWWERSDASTLDIMAANADVTQLPPWAFSLDFIEQAIRPKSTTAATSETENREATTNEPKSDNIVRGIFRPKVINGGSDTTSD